MKPNLLLYLLGGTNKNTFSPKESPIRSSTGKKRVVALKLSAFLSFLIVMAFSQQAYSQTNTWDGSGGANWNINSSWSLNHVPLVGEDVVIPNGVTANITVNTAAVCRTFTMNGGGSSNTVSIGAGQSLTVTNGISIAAGTSGGTLKVIAVGTGTLSCASITMANTTGDNRDSEVTVSTGTINVTGNITMDGSSLRNAVRFTGAGLLNLGGNFLGIGGGILVPSTGTVNCNGANPQLISGTNTVSFYNLTINKTAAGNTVTGTTNAFTVANDLTVTQGNLLLQATNANYTVTNDVIIAANGTLTNGVDYITWGTTLSVGGDWINNGGSFIPATGAVNFNSTTINQNIQGTAATQTFNNIIVNKTGRLLNVAGSTTTLNLNANMTLTAGTFVAGTAAAINITGNWTNNGATFTPGTGTVTFNSTTATQNITGSAATQTFNNITVTKAGQQLTVAGSTATLNLNGSMTLTAGTFAAGTAAAINVGGDWTNNGATFTPGTGTVTFNSTTATQNINGTSATQTFYNITVNKAGQQLNVAGSTTTLNITRSITLTAGTFAAGTAAAIYVDLNWTNNGGSFTPGTGTVTFNNISATQSINGTNATQTFNNITVTKSGQQLNVAGSTTTLNLNGSMTLNAGTFVAGTAANINIAGDWNNTGATFTAGTGTVTFNSTTGTQNIQGTVATQTFNNIGVNKSGQQLNVAGSTTTLNFNGSMTLTAGTFAAGTAAAINIAGNWTNNGGAFTPGTGTVTFNSTTATQNINGTNATQTFNNIIVNKAGQQLNVAGSTTTLNMNASMTLTAGTFAAGTAANINIAGDWNNNSATFTPGTGTVTFNSTTTNQNIQGTSATQTFNNITVNKSGQQLNVAGSTTTLILNGSMTITAGTFAAGTATAINIAGTWTNNGGAFSAGSGTVTFNGGAAQVVNGSTVTTFNNIVINNANGVSLSGIDVNISGGAGTLAFLNGKITTGANRVILGTAGTISGAGVGKYVYGNLRLGVATGSPTRVFEIGDAAAYTPLSVVFNSVTVSGSVTAYTVGTEHPNITSSIINESKSVNRYWNMVNTGVSLTNYTPTFNFLASDIDAGANTNVFIIGRRTSSWAYPTVSGRTATSTTATLSSFGDYGCGEGGAIKPVITLETSDQTACSGTSTNFTSTATAAPVSTALWQISTDGGTIFNTIVIASPYSVSTSSVGSATTSTLTINPTTVAMDGYQYRVIFTNSRGMDTSYHAPLTIIPGPTVNVGPALNDICGSGSSAPLGGSVGGSATGGTWSTAAGGTFSPNANTLNAIWTPPIGYSGTATLILTTSGGTCGSVNDSKTQLVGTLPNTISATPSTATICNGAIQTITASNAYTSNASSGTVNLAIPNNSAAGVTSTLAIAAVPAGATITGISVTFNVTHAEVADLMMNLRAPNGSILNLANRPTGGAGTNFTNTVVSSSGVTAFSAGSSPFTGTFRADATNGIGATGQVSNVTTFPSLYSIANGNWVLSARDNALANSGTLVSWSITITYSDPVTWSPVTGLYTNAAATIPYVAGQNYTTVYSKPATAGTIVYTATATNITGCTDATTATVNTGPVVSITTDYCYGGGLIQLTAVSTPAATSWLWNTGATTQSILVDLAGLYQVTATTGGGCVGAAAASIAQELVVNGDFSAGNTGFTSSYTYVDPTVPNGMYPEATYTVNENPTFNHNYFFGRDHTSNTGKFMIVNGAGSTVTIWEETMAVQPNTTYYFSAWAISLNDVPPYAQLQFDVNGAALGTTAVLAAGPTNNNPPYNWVRFYGNWTSGPGVTSATVGIKDLQTALGGNDFGLDDISFGTLSTFITHTSAAGTDSQTVCKNTALVANTYSVGGGAAGPIVTGLPAGVTSSFNGVSLSITGTPTTVGVYPYTVTTTGTCNPVTAYGRIIVLEDSINLTSAAGTDAQSVCVNTPATAITYHIGVSSTGASASGLPAGITGSYSAGVFTISGTPTVAGVFNYIVTTTGGCVAVTATGTIYVRRQIITRSSPAGTNTQTLCINTAITNITYAIGGTATGAGVTGLPAGVTGSYSASVFTISGTPTVAGIFSYVVTTTGTCASVTASGTITVNAQSITLSSAAGTNAQSVCNNSAITNITYAVGGTATNATVSGLPTGVSGSFSAGVFTITGTPSVIGVYSYTVTTSGTCSPVATANGTITVGQQTIGLTSAAGTDAQQLCINTAITNITYAIGGMATGAGVTGLPAGVSGSYSAGVYTISGTPTASGTFNYTVTTSGSCSSATAANGSITVSPAPVGGNIANMSICFADNGNLTLTGSVGTVTRWETSVDGTTWTNIANTTTTQPFTGLTQGTWYRALVQSGFCASPVYSNSAKVGIHNLWTGETSSDWNTGSNWSDGLMPTTSCPDVTIPVLTLPNVYPQLTSGTATVNNIIIYPNATLIVSNATLQIAGTITNNGTFVASNGTIELNGTSGAQAIAGSIFDAHAIQNLIISNSNGVSFSNTNDTVKITGLLSFGTSNAVLNTNNNLTLISNAAGTASVGDMTNGGAYSGNNITGNATVERYIPVHPKAWQFLATPTSGQTINNAWQEGNTPLANTTHPGYGTIITSPIVGAVALGFDVYTPSGPTMKTYNPATNGWDGVASPSIQIANKKGYMFFVRGDRSVITSAAPATATILRTTGKLFTVGADAPASTTVLAGKMESLGNPYASAIDFRLITKPAAPAVDDAFYVWDPLLTNNYFGLGGYQTISAANGWRPIPGGTTNYDVSTAYPFIQSGQAFLVHATGAGGTISFSEANKVSSYSMANRPVARMADRQFLRLSLVTGGMASDGNVVAFDSDFSNAYTADDALKISNTNENIGIKKDDKTLALEARAPVAATDTVFYTMSNMRRPSYQLRFYPENMAAGLTAQLVDKFLNTTTPVNLTDTSSIDFTVSSVPGSYAADRFFIIFTQVSLPAITAITATRNLVNAPVTINWTVEHEAGIQGYQVQRGSDGTTFASIMDADVTGNNGGTHAYSAIDPDPLRGTSYYRIKGVKNNGAEFYSTIVKLIAGNNQPATRNGIENTSNTEGKDTKSINIYPNPVVDKIVHVHFMNQPKGIYKLELMNRFGESVHTKTAHIDGNTIETLHLDRSLAAGNYQLKITVPGNASTVKQVIIK